mmetsp:Transcript_29999/g.44460  ORF Transcript_29999/g.44460 Transcript_29999/m.44460 type:complete len:195 (+) Transcript_29999:86-670(+)|eukprot:CAMPEP_0195528532 /NCGR_PEP_ID=MMETSP0794_2-20130614/30712_1 /TAXON_ID=515487 /ORGANISM="Stephanopyxis turris, Strain CCMP 815" /LENGTH=194 /DNA_ID=CAMNT_0040659687 /DNA_START=89 /DNA_END=673 /DNA_ORIENTATION=+
MKVVLAALLLARVAADNTFDYDDDSDAALQYAVVAGGDENTVTEEYGFIGGGFKNSVDGAYGTVAGGYKNMALSNYATISGGFLNAVTGRFATVTGGARNNARGRYSLAAGYKADAKGDYTAAFGFSGETCTTSQANQIAFCADSFLFNGLELLDLFSRRSLSTEELDEVVTAQNKVIEAQNERIARIEAVLQL